MAMTTKLGRVATYNEGLPSIESQDPLITLSCKVTCKIQYVISLLSQSPWPPNLVEC